MAKSKKPLKSRESYPKLPAQAAKPVTAKPAAASQSHAVRETVESIVIAFVLAFLFRTFEAEAFVIPTGSMAPTLMGRHKDVDCEKCGQRYRVNASIEDAPNFGSPADQECIAGMCPNCRYVMPMAEDLPTAALDGREREEIDYKPSYNGDRILVNKYIYTLGEPERWDVVVFKFPGNAHMNYIKRLVGLPNEVVRIRQGDLFTGPPGSSQDDDFEIERKPADKVLAMRQLVHDTENDPAELYAAGWPLRWKAAPGDGGSAWKRAATVEGKNVRQRYSVDGAADVDHWLRYEHVIPDYDVWQAVSSASRQGRQTSEPAAVPGIEAAARPQLITDFNAYNTKISRVQAYQQESLRPEPKELGVHWVGDLMLEAEVEVQGRDGELLLDVVEAGKHFICRIDVATGKATLGAADLKDFAPKADTSVNGPGAYHIAFANVDDRLLLWIDGDLVSFEGDTAYDAIELFSSRDEIVPQTSDTDPADLAPAGIGSRGAKLTVSRLQLWRDIYYIADSAYLEDDTRRSRNISDPITDFDRPDIRILARLPYDPSLWDTFHERRAVNFPLAEDQFFVMGDNSAASSDARLWRGDFGRGGTPGGDYLERRLLTGKALCVYWPHSWNRIPGTPIPFPLFPNFADMRLVR